MGAAKEENLALPNVGGTVMGRHALRYLTPTLTGSHRYHLFATEQTTKAH